jgi:hypothetical protein
MNRSRWFVKSLYLSYVTAFALICASPRIAGQEIPSPDPSPPEGDSPEIADAKELLELETILAGIEEQKKKRAEAEAAIDALNDPKSDTKGLEGKVTFAGNAGYFSEVLAYKSLSDAAARIALSVAAKCESASDPIVVMDQLDLAQVASLWSVVNSKLRFQADALDTLDKSYPKTYPDVQEAVPALMLLPEILGLASEVAAFFKVNRDVFARTITLNSHALTAEVARQLQPVCDVRIPALHINASGPLQKSLFELQQHRSVLQARLKAFEKKFADDVKKVSKFKTDIAKLESDKEKLEAAKPQDAAKIAEVTQQLETMQAQLTDCACVNGNESWTKVNTDFTAAFKAVDALLEGVTTPPEKGQKSVYEVVAPIDAIKSAGSNPKLLFLSILSQGGEMEVTTSVWTGGRISFIGGSVAVFYATGPCGDLLASGTLSQSRRAKYGTRRGVATLEELDTPLVANVTQVPKVSKELDKACLTVSDEPADTASTNSQPPPKAN